LPIVYRILHQSKVGTKPDWGAAYETNQYIWWLLVPALCALSTALPPARSKGALWPQRAWLPLSFFSLWLVGTWVHLYCLGYVYDFDLRPELLAPSVWILFWALCVWVARMLPGPKPAWKGALWTLPLLSTLLAAPQNGKQVFLVLTVLNVASYGVIYLRRRAPLALHLLLISTVALIGGLPQAWAHHFGAEINRETLLGAGAGIYLVVCAALSPKPKMGFLGALVAATIVNAIGQHPQTSHWATQIGLAFLLLHSLRWTTSLEEGANAVRWLTALAWVAHSFVWTHVYGAGWMPCAVAIPVLGAVLVLRWLQGRWSSLAVPLAAGLVLLCPPGRSAAVQLQLAPAGLLAIIGSFVLFGLGTVAALTKHRWASR